MSAAERTQQLRQFSQHDSVPNSWPALLALVCFIAIASVIGIGLMQRYLYTKPVYAGAIESSVEAIDDLEVDRDLLGWREVDERCGAAADLARHVAHHQVHLHVEEPIEAIG